jgi:REP element-mobilizing transposase RayT
MSDFDDLYPGHRSIRLKDYDYSSSGFYFVTICSDKKRCVFGRSTGPRIQLAPLGQIVQSCWIAIPQHFPGVLLHDFVIMPNHFHGMIEIVCQAGAQHAAPLQAGGTESNEILRVKPSSLSAIVRSLKAAVSKRAREEIRWRGTVWQRNYYERILRNATEIADAGAYIVENPRNWAYDLDNPERAEL